MEKQIRSVCYMNCAIHSQCPKALNKETFLTDTYKENLIALNTMSHSHCIKTEIISTGDDAVCSRSILFCRRHMESSNYTIQSFHESWPYGCVHYALHEL